MVCDWFIYSLGNFSNISINDRFYNTTNIPAFLNWVHIAQYKCVYQSLTIDSPLPLSRSSEQTRSTVQSIAGSSSGSQSLVDLTQSDDNNDDEDKPPVVRKRAKLNHENESSASKSISLCCSLKDIEDLDHVPWVPSILFICVIYCLGRQPDSSHSPGFRIILPTRNQILKSRSNITSRSKTLNLSGETGIYLSLLYHNTLTDEYLVKPNVAKIFLKN